jgi:hypothetical protein
MRLISVKEILAGAALATASSLAFNASPANAFTPCGPATLGSLNNTTCQLSGYSLAISNVTGGNSLPSGTTNTTAFQADEGGNFFGIGQVGTRAAGSFNFTVTADSGRFFKSSDFILSSNVSSVTALPNFTFTANGDSWTAPDNSITSISGTYFYNNTAPNSISSIAFVTDVPVPLPLVGAGLAFGFTRNLRKRAKSVA